MVADEKYRNKLCDCNSVSGGIYAFVRKSQVASKDAQKLLFYVKKPVMQVRGVADFIERLTGQRRIVEEIWRRKLL